MFAVVPKSAAKVIILIVLRLLITVFFWSSGIWSDVLWSYSQRESDTIEIVYEYICTADKVNNLKAARLITLRP